jgi:glycosyltransferase involved in cell wall biosynthesis
MFASILSGLPYSLSLLGPTLEGYGPNQTNKWRHADFVVVMSKLLYDHSKKVLDGFLPPIVEIAPVGVDLDVMKRAGQYTPWKQGEVAKIYACGRLNPVKAHPDLVDAVAVLRERGIDAQLIIAGEDEKGGQGYRRDIEQHIQRRNAAGFVTLLGAVSEDKHRECLQNAHIFALTSLNEGISVAIMEAMAMQTPVVATAVGGNAELIETSVNGMLVKPQDPPLFADVLEKVLRDAAFATSLTERSRQTVAEKFDSRSAAKIIVRCLERAQTAKAGHTVAGATPA